GKPCLRLMRPLAVKAGCLKCHGFQGYKEGDIRGGVGVTLPMKPFLDAESREVRNLVVSYVAVYVIGIMGMILGVRRLERRENERDQAMAELQIARSDLQERVRERTVELSDINAQLREEVAQRKRSEESLLRANDLLEARVEQRTWDLSLANQQLRDEIVDRKKAQDNLQISVEELSAINSVAAAVNSTLSMQEVLACAQDQVLAALGPDAVVVYLRDGDNLHLEGVAEKQPETNLHAPSVKAVGECLCGIAVAEQRGIYSRDINSDPRCTLNECKQAGFRSFAAVPLIVEGDVVGVLGVASLAEREFSEEAAFLETIAVQIAASVQNAKLHEQLRNANEDLEQRVQERTMDLVISNEDLIREAAVRREAEEALRKSEQMYRAIFNNAAIGINLMDNDRHFVQANAALAKMLGYTNEELKDLTNIDVTHPTDVGISGERLDALMRGDISSYRLQKRYVRKSGEVVWGDIYVSGIPDDQGRHPTTIGVIADITERKLAEEQLALFRSLADASGQGFGMATLEGDIIYTNTTLCRLVGEDSLADVEGKPMFQYYPEAIAQRLKDEILPTVKEEGQWLGELKLLAIDDRLVPTIENWFLVRDDEGAPLRLAVVITDITDRKRYEERQEQLVKELKRFSYVVSHDLRAPLANLRGFSRELQRSLDSLRPVVLGALPELDGPRREAISFALDEDIPEAMGFIEASASRMEHLIDAILKLSRIGRRDLELEVLHMSNLVRETFNSLAHQINRAGVRMEVTELPDVLADRTSMEQIMGNLISNVINYLAPDRPGEVIVTGERISDETLFRVSDNGIGINKSDVGRVFDMFQRAGGHEIEGEGMGLAHVRTLVWRHGGRIWCESEPGVGSTFIFTVAHELEIRDHGT
ncbi:PAS domain S-box protein, partial [Thermodesulfobacteriota bacterium]